MSSSIDDSKEILRLLSEAEERYRSARATIAFSVDATVAEESRRRFVDWRFEQPGGSGLGILRTAQERREHGPDVPQDFYLRYEDTERTVRLWHERPDRWREEIRGAENRLLRCVVFGGAKGPRWVYEPPETAIHVPVRDVEWPHQDPYTNFSFMLDPSEEYFYYALLDDAYLRWTGKRACVAGRDAVEVQVETVSWGYSPMVFNGFHAPEGTTDHLLLIDAETGTVLRAAARLEGREFYVAEVTEIFYNEKFPEDTFRLNLPGVEFKTSEI